METKWYSLNESLAENFRIIVEETRGLELDRQTQLLVVSQDLHNLPSRDAHRHL